MTEEKDSVLVRVEMEPDGDHTFALVNNLWINHDENNFFVRYYQIIPPLVTEPGELPERIKARLVGAIIIPASEMAVFIQVMQTNLDKYREKFPIKDVTDEEDGG